MKTTRWLIASCFFFLITMFIGILGLIHWVGMVSIILSGGCFGIWMAEKGIL